MPISSRTAKIFHFPAANDITTVIFVLSLFWIVALSAILLLASPTTEIIAKLVKDPESFFRLCKLLWVGALILALMAFVQFKKKTTISFANSSVIVEKKGLRTTKTQTFPSHDVQDFLIEDRLYYGHKGGTNTLHHLCLKTMDGKVHSLCLIHDPSLKSQLLSQLNGALKAH